MTIAAVACIALTLASSSAVSVTSLAGSGDSPLGPLLRTFVSRAAGLCDAAVAVALGFDPESPDEPPLSSLPQPAITTPAATATRQRRIPRPSMCSSCSPLTPPTAAAAGGSILRPTTDFVYSHAKVAH